MNVPKFFETVPYVRSMPIIFGQNYIYDFEGLLRSDNITQNSFIAQVFSGLLKIQQDDTLAFYPTTDVESFQILSDDNDELQVSALLASSTEYKEFKGIIIPLMRPGFTIYGHWLLDILPKLAQFEKMNPGMEYTVVVDDRCSAWVIDLISSLFPRAKTIEKVSANIVLKGNFFLMSPIRKHDFVSQFCRIPIDVPLLDIKQGRKIYLSRKHFNSGYRQLENSEKIEKLFKKKGFELIYPEELSIKKQMELFSQTSILAGEAGSALHNSIFCPKNTVVINIQSGRQNHFIQSSLNNQYEQKVIYVSCKTETDDWGSSFVANKRDCKLAIKKAMSFF